MKYFEFVKSKMTTRALLEGLAEESAELAQAALKVVRATYKENPTPVTVEKASDNLIEEMKDLTLYEALLIGDDIPQSVYEHPKWKRWAERLGYGKE